MDTSRQDASTPPPPPRQQLPDSRLARESSSSFSTSELLECLAAVHQRLWELAHHMAHVKMQRDHTAKEILDLVRCSSSAPSYAVISSLNQTGVASSLVTLELEAKRRAMDEQDRAWDEKFKEMRVALCAAQPLLTLLDAAGVDENVAHAACQRQQHDRDVHSDKDAMSSEESHPFYPSPFDLGTSRSPSKPTHTHSAINLMHPSSFRLPNKGSPQHKRLELVDDSISIQVVDSERATPADSHIHQASISEGELRPAAGAAAFRAPTSYLSTAGRSSSDSPRNSSSAGERKIITTAQQKDVSVSVASPSTLGPTSLSSNALFNVFLPRTWSPVGNGNVLFGEVGGSPKFPSGMLPTMESPWNNTLGDSSSSNSLLGGRHSVVPLHIPSAHDLIVQRRLSRQQQR